MSRVIIYSNFKMNGHNFARFQNSLKNSLSMLGYILFMRWIVFLEFSENNGKSITNHKDYKSQVGICFTCRMNCPILPHFYRILGKMQKTGTNIEYDKLGCIPLTGWILRFCPVFPELTHQTEIGVNWLWKARMYPTCGINCQILPYLSLINEKIGKLV